MGGAFKTRRAYWSKLERLGLWGALDQGILAGSGLVVVLAVARTGGPQALGAFAFVQSAILIVAGVLKAGFGDPFVVEARGQGESGGLQAALPLVAGLALLGFGLAAVWPLFAGHIPGLPRPNALSLILALLLPFASFCEVARSFRLAGFGERHLFLGDLLVAIARLSALGLCFAGVRGLPLGLAALASSGVASVMSISGHLHGLFEVSHVVRLWKLGRWLVGESLLYGLGAYGVWLLAAPRAGTAVIGALRAAQQLFAPVQLIVNGLNIILLSRLAERKGELTGAARCLSVMQVASVASWGVVVATLGPEVGVLLFGDRFVLTRPELSILAAAVSVGVTYEVAALRLRAARLVRSLVTTRAIVTVAALAGTAAIGTSFVRVAAAVLVSQLLGTWLASMASSRQRRMGQERRPSWPV